MAELPILFTPQNSCTILRELSPKRQTRRVLKIQPPDNTYTLARIVETTGNTRDIGKFHWVKYHNGLLAHDQRKLFSFPHNIGDHLWIKETHYRFGKWIGIGMSNMGRPAWRFTPESDEIKYVEDPPAAIMSLRSDRELIGWWKRSPLFMPKSAARIWLDVTDVRWQYLQEINEEDAIAEGILESTWKFNCNPYRSYLDTGVNSGSSTAVAAFWRLWESINGKTHPWADNPAVSITEFKLIAAPVSLLNAPNLLNEGV